MVPLTGPRGVVLGRVVGPLDPSRTDVIIQATYRGVTVFLAARRVTRWTDPQQIYICQDGGLWRSDHPPVSPVVAAVVTGTASR